MGLLSHSLRSWALLSDRQNQKEGMLFRIWHFKKRDSIDLRSLKDFCTRMKNIHFVDKNVFENCIEKQLHIPEKIATQKFLN
jgi:hypothetical protein